MAYVTIQDLRKRPELADTATYSDDLLNEGIEYAVELIDRYCGATFEEKPFSTLVEHREASPFRWVLRLGAVAGPRSLTYARDVRGVLDVSGWDLDPDEGLVYPDVPVCGAVRIKGTANATPDGVPAAIRFCAGALAEHYARELYSRIPDRALSITGDMGMMQLAQAGGPGRPTPFPDVNARLNSYRFGASFLA